MDKEDHKKTHSSGHEMNHHGVYVCHKCGWPFPNPHPSAKHRRAHKKICGTIEGYKKLCVSEDPGQTRSNGSDDEHVSGDDHKALGLAVSTPNALDTGNNEKGNDGIGEKLTRSEDDVFSDAVAHFSDSGQSPGFKERFQEDSLDSGSNVERVNEKDPKFSGSLEDNDFKDVSQLTTKATSDSQIQNPKIIQSEEVEVGSTLELQSQLSGSTVGPLSSSIAVSMIEELTVFRSDEVIELSTDSHKRKAEAMSEELPENEIYTGENATGFSFTSVAKEKNLKGKDETESDRDEVETAVPSDNVVEEACEQVSKAVNLKEKNSAEFLSAQAQDDLPLELNSIVITTASPNDVQVESAQVVQFSNSGSGDVEILEKEERNANANTDTALTCEVRQDFKNQEAVLSQNPLTLHSSESFKHEEDDFKDKISGENNSVLNPSQSTKKSDVLSPDMHSVDGSSSVKEEVVHTEPVAEEKHAEEYVEVSPVEITAEKSDVPSPDMHVVDGSSSMKEELVNNEPMAEETHTEECSEVSPVELAAESNIRLDEISESMDAVKTEMNESHIFHFSEEQESFEVKNSEQIDLPETTPSVISTDNISHHEKNRTELNDVAVDANKDLGGNEKDDIGIKTKDLQLSDLQLDVKQSGEMVEIEKCDVTDVQCKEKSSLRDASSLNPASNHIESSVISEVAIIDESMTESEGKEDEISGNIKVQEECNRSIGTSAGSHQAQEDSELLVKAAEDLARKYASLFSPSTEPAAQHHFAVADDQEEGDPSRNLSGITAVHVQDHSSGNNLVKPSSSGTRIDASADSGSQCDSLEANWGSFSVLSMLSDAPAASTDAETLPSTCMLASSTEEALKSNPNIPKASSSERQESGKSELFEPPSFMSLVEPKWPMVSMVTPKEAVSEPQKGQNPQQPNESQGRKNNEEIIAKITHWSTTTKEHTPLKSLLGEAAYDKNGKVRENNNSSVGLTTVNSILGPESPPPSSSQEAVKVGEEAAREWDSPARYPAQIKREKRRVKSRPYWIQLVCCSSVDPQRR